jgi:hypothetical protein
MNAQIPHSERDALYRQARRRVLQLKGFYSHLAAYVAVNAGLVAINLLFTPGHLWFLWPLLGWGIGLLSHAAGVFRPFRIFPRDWEERKIRELMEQARRS